MKIVMKVVVWLVYRFVKWAVFFLPIRAYYRFDIKGKNNLPKGGGYILAANHLGKLDTLVIPVYLRSQVSFATKIELFQYVGLKQVLKYTGMIPLRRTNASYRELKTFCRKAISVLKNGLVLVIFPEGTRSKTGQLLPFEPGAAFLASSTGRVLVPVGLSYSHGSLWPPSRPVVHISIGEPMECRGYKRDDVTLELRRRIAELSGQRLAENGV